MTRNAAWDVLDQFSKVTKFAQDTGLVEHPLARPVLPLIPTQITNLLLSSQEAEQLMSEYDSAHIYLAKFADSIQDGVKKRLKRKPLSDLAGRTDAAGNEIDTTDCYDFDKLSVGIIPKRVPMGNALSGEQWVSLFDESGKLALPEDEMRSIIFNQGVHPDCKRDVWKFLLKVYAWDSTERERVERLKGLTAQYESMKRHLGGDIVSKIKERKNRVEKDVIRTDRTTPYFQGIPADNEILLKSPTSPSPSSPSSSPPTLSKNLEMLKNVLLTYTIYNFDLGYVQGMNDLLSPILETMDDEVEAFWCFVGWMELKKENFSRDQEGMRNQLRLLEGLIKLVDPLLHEHLDRIDSTNLFCCFRWMLIVFKREFKFTDVQNTLWESIWSCPFSATHFHFFIALAILNKHRGHIMTQCTAFDELLKYLNELSEKEDVEDIVRRAEVLFVVFKRTVE
ncbi:rab-GTPase-TBC domain-containing protein [Obelidium mucronatum]|nr:rab-GTPase-TBC domain-containing protein [Obelidium mucronatum]